MVVRDDPQLAFEEETIYDPQLSSAIEAVLNTKDAVRRNRKAKKEIKKLMTGRPEGRYRIGEHVIVVTSMAGGNFYVEG